jgi:outer membrane protein assembly factor BamC
MASNHDRLLLSSVLLATLAGCSSFSDTGEVFSDRRVEYRKSQGLERDLEVPPDLTKATLDDPMQVPDAAASSSATYSEFMRQQQNRREGTVVAAAAPARVLPKVENVELKQDGNQRWLEIAAPADDVWQRLLGFWQENGILLVEQDPLVGVMLTDWIENRADIKSDFITDSVRKVFDGAYAAGTRDQYRIRLEHGKGEGITELYLTQRGMQEEFARGSTGEEQQSRWVPGRAIPAWRRRCCAA